MCLERFGLPNSNYLILELNQSALIWVTLVALARKANRKCPIMDPPTMGKKASDRRVCLNALSIILFARVKGCKGGFIFWGFLFFGLVFCLCFVRSGASCALHGSVCRNVASTWESCAWCRKAWGDCCTLSSPLCFGRVEGEPLHGWTLAARCCFGRGKCWS